MRALKDEFARLKPRLERDGKANTVAGAYARAMLALMPALIAHLETEGRRQLTPNTQTFEGIAGALSNVVMHTIRETFDPAYRLVALEAMLQQINGGVRPLIERTRAGIILPGAE